MKLYDVNEFENIKEMLETRAVTHKDKIAFYQKNENKEFDEITYEQLKKDVDALGTALLHMGLKDKKIAIIGKNSYEWAISYIAIMCGVGVVVPLDKQLADNEIKNCLQRIDIDTIIHGKEFEDRLKGMETDTKIKNYISMEDGNLSISDLILKGNRLIEEGNREYIDSKIDRDKLASLLFTSGTTSKSKIVMLSQRNIMYNVTVGQKMINTKEGDIFFSVLPLSHTLESTCVLLYPLACGSAIVYNDNLKNLIKDIKATKPTSMMVVPRVVELFYEKITSEIEKKNKVKQVKIAMALTDLLGSYGVSLKRKVFKEVHEQFGGNLRLLIMGGAPVNPKISKYFRGLGILALQGYGLTECAPLVTFNSDREYADDSAGMAVPGSEVLIVNPDSDGIGEIIVKGPQIMLGYYEDEEATKEAIKNGYFYTGDLGKFDEKGFLRISGRCKNVIVSSNGKNIFPEEIESLINENQNIKESVVYEEEKGNGRKSLTAEVVLIDEIKQRIEQNPEATEEIMEILNEYLKEVNNKLSDYKQVSGIKVRETDFDKTSTMKIKRFTTQKRN
jgi:long-chain acyl-CoA synthetase